MSAPAFHDVPSADGCSCPACSAAQLARSVRRLRASGLGDGRRRTPLRPLVTVAAAGTVLTGVGTAHAAPTTAPSAPAASPTAINLPGGGRSVAWTGRRVDAEGDQGRPVSIALTREEILARAERWLDTRVPYSQSRYRDGYRTDCSGYVSMAWALGDSAWTGSLTKFAVRIDKDDLAAGDILLFHNPADPARGSHVVLFDHWADPAHASYVGYEQTPPHTVRRIIPYGYFTHASQYRAYRYRDLTAGDGSGSSFPGRSSFGPGTGGTAVSQLESMLMARGGTRFYPDGPGAAWSDADRAATRAFQRAQGWQGDEADGLPGPHTWRLLVTGGGRNIPDDGDAPDFPGAEYFAPGRTGDPVLALGRRLVALGYGSHYRVGPNPVWTEADRLNVRDFQRNLGWRGEEADGYPGPDTWAQLFD